MVEKKAPFSISSASIESSNTQEHIVPSIMQRHPIKGPNEDKSLHSELHMIGGLGQEDEG